MTDREYSELYKSWVRHLKRNRLFVRWCFYIKGISYTGRTLTSPMEDTGDFILNGFEIPFHATMVKTEDTDVMKFLMMMMSKSTIKYHEDGRLWYEELNRFFQKRERETRRHKNLENETRGGKGKKVVQGKWYDRYYKGRNKLFSLVQFIVYTVGGFSQFYSNKVYEFINHV